MSGTNQITTRGDQTLIGSTHLVDAHMSEGTFTIYANTVNADFPHNSTEQTVWQPLEGSYPTREAAIIAAVNIAGGA